MPIFLLILLEHFNLLTGTVDMHNLNDMIHINNQNSRQGTVIWTVQDDAAAFKGQQQVLKHDKKYQCQRLLYKKELPTKQTNQMTDTNLQQELRIYSIPLNVLTISNET